MPRSGAGSCASMRSGSTTRKCTSSWASSGIASCRIWRRCVAGRSRRATSSTSSSTPSGSANNRKARTAMGRAYDVIDADGHVLEPVDIWDKYIDPGYRERAPRIIVDTDGKERLLVGQQVLGSQKGFGVIGAIGSRDHEMPEETMKYIDGRMLHHPDYEVFWSAVEDLDMSIGLHEGASGGMPQAGVDRFETRGAKHIVSHTVEMMLAAMSVIWEGVCDRHPKVRIGFLESGGGWIAPWLDRMNRHFDDQGFNDSGLTMRPSELFQRNCWISFEPVEGSLSVLADYNGPHKILWATDYPHPDGFFPGAPKLIADRPELSAETKRQILAGGGIGVYGPQ